MIEPQPPIGFSGLVAFGVARLVEEELLEPRVGLEASVLRSLERRRVGRLGEFVRVERRVAVDPRVVDRHPFGVERIAVGVQGDLVGAVERRLAGERDRFVARVQHLQRLQLAVLEVARMGGHVAIDEAVGPLRRRARLARAADVLDDPDVAVGVVLDALVAAAA
jgi:hypothetical protein